MQHTVAISNFGYNVVSRIDLPFELFFPMPSLSTTSSLHLIRRDEEVSSAAGASSARSLRVAGKGTDCSRDSVVVRREFEAGCRDRDIFK